MKRLIEERVGRMRAGVIRTILLFAEVKPVRLELSATLSSAATHRPRSKRRPRTRSKLDAILEGTGCESLFE